MINEKPQRVHLLSLGLGLFQPLFIPIQLSPPASRIRLAAMIVTATRGSAITEAEAIAGLINTTQALTATLCSPATLVFLRFSFDIKI
jgi:hypothetical protein